MLKPGLVSVISPCYNVAPYLPFFFESLLSQTYKELEIILINDGSTDSTDTVISSWLPKLEGAGFLIKYIVKENGGQSSAINAALPHFTGEFLTWVDPDDFLYCESIAKKVEFLKKNPELGFVRSECDIFNENDRNKIIGTIKRASRYVLSENIFKDLIFERTYITCHCYMVRSDAFLDVNPNRSIYVRKGAGQNRQMLLPLAAKYNCGYLPVSLCGYLVRENSHSHSNQDLSSKLNNFNTNLDVLKNTLKSIGLDTAAIENELDVIYALRRCHLGLNYKNHTLVNNELRYIDETYKLTLENRVLKILCRNKYLFNIIALPLWSLRKIASRIINRILISIRKCNFVWVV